MKKISTIAACMLLAGTAHAQTAGSNAVGQSASDAGAMAQTGAITFEASEQRGHTSVSTTPNVYVAPSMFGPSPENCGNSDSVAASVTGFGFGVSKANESISCNARRDVATAWNLGQQDVARMRFNCFGEDLNRQAFEAVGGSCPSSATAKGIEGAPVGPKFYVAQAMPQTLRGTIGQDGTVTYK